jgi:hypothetical protein
MMASPSKSVLIHCARAQLERQVFGLTGVPSAYSLRLPSRFASATMQLSFPLTAAGQSRSFTGFPFQTGRIQSPFDLASLARWRSAWPNKANFQLN